MTDAGEYIAGTDPANLTGFPTIAFTNLFSQAAGKVEFYVRRCGHLRHK